MPSPHISTLSLHDALPISRTRCSPGSATSSPAGNATVTRASSRASTVTVWWLRPRCLRRSSLSDIRAQSTTGHPRAAAACALSDRKSTRLNSSHMSISYAVPPHLHSFPTRRSSDLADEVLARQRHLVPGRERDGHAREQQGEHRHGVVAEAAVPAALVALRHPRAEHDRAPEGRRRVRAVRSEEHTSELQSHVNLVCRPPTSPLFPYTTLFRSRGRGARPAAPPRPRPGTRRSRARAAGRAPSRCGG